jgi:hypothetical protein
MIPEVSIQDRSLASKSLSTYECDELSLYNVRGRARSRAKHVVLVVLIQESKAKERRREVLLEELLL